MATLPTNPATGAPSGNKPGAWRSEPRITSPVDDRTSYAEDYLRARITCALGGRAAEKLVYGVATTGAENDLQQVTEIARHMRHG